MRANQILPTTTDHELSASVRYAQDALSNIVARAETNLQTDEVAKAANEIARQIGRRNALGQIRNALQNGASIEAVTRILTRGLTNSPDDTWSGRSNDARRAEADGFRETAGEWIEEN